MSSTPRGGLGTFWRRICTAPSAFRPPRLLCGRAASYGSIIVWKYQKAELFGFQGADWSLVKAYQKFFCFGSDWQYPLRTLKGVLVVPPGSPFTLETPLGIFSFSGLEKRSLHLRAIEKGLFIASIFKFHKTITFHHVLPLIILGSPPFVLDAPGRVGNLLAADLHRSIGLSAAPPSLWPGRELRKYHCLEVPGG